MSLPSDAVTNEGLYQSGRTSDSRRQAEFAKPPFAPYSLSAPESKDGSSFRKARACRPSASHHAPSNYSKSRTSLFHTTGLPTFCPPTKLAERRSIQCNRRLCTFNLNKKPSQGECELPTPQLSCPALMQVLLMPVDGKDLLAHGNAAISDIIGIKPDGVGMNVAKEAE